MTLAVLGSGSLARAVCYGLAVVVPYPLRVVVGARSPRAAADLCAVAGVRATLSGNPVEFVPAEFDFAATARPDGVLLCASTQSPWESPSGWTALAQRAGFGLSLPLHAELAVDVGRSADRVGAWFLNACYPDAVNPVLAALGIPVLAGIGNVATLAAGLRTALGREPALLAHHAHLHAPADPADEARAWSAGAPVADVGALLRTHRAVARRELNHITGYAAALLLRDLLAGEDVATHAPGPSGLPGGYPVLIGRGRVALRLPAGVTEAEAVAMNQRWAELDGVVVSDGAVRFGAAASAELRSLAPELADGFAVSSMTAAAARLHEVRSRLRSSA